MQIIQVKNLYKNYKKIEAVKGISFSVKQGEIFGLLGPNGAGKTTTINVLCTLLKQSSGARILASQFHFLLHYRFLNLEFYIGSLDRIYITQIGKKFKENENYS